MATITRPNEQDERSNALSDLFARVFVLNWEVIAWTAILVFAIFTRFYILGDRVMSHDESLHTVFSNNLYERGDYQHDPMMHGPILFHATAFSYFLFGVSDFSARIYPAVLGVIIVMFPLLFRRWIGTKGAVLAAIMLLLSPLLTYYSRYIRHDIPSILSGMIMFYAAMMYLSGPQNQRRRAHWLYILSAAMLWNLGSKETAFIYIAIFGSFLTLYWLVRVAQEYFDVDGRMVFDTTVIGFLLAGVAALAMIVVITISLVQQGTLDSRVTYLGDQFGFLVRGDAIEPAFSSFLSWTGLVIVSMLTIIIGPAVWAYRRRHERFEIPDALMLFGGMLVFILFGVVLSPDYVRLVEGVEVRTTLAAVGLAVGLILALSFWLIYAAIRVEGRRTFNKRLLTIILIAVVATGFLLLFEELSFEPSRDGQPESQPIPGEEVAASTSEVNLLPLLSVWFGAGAVIAFLLFARARNWWRLLEPFPEFDILLVMGSLILPWMTAFVLVATGGSPADYAAIANDVGRLADIVPKDDPAQIGKIIVGFLSFVPLAAVAITAGVLWNWRRWVICAIVFNGLFAFFFTTVFTNIQGLASGMVYSLEYWLEQQGERRGNQPQYYYTTIIIPFYEFLPAIGSFLAMIAGMVMFWRRNRDYEDYKAAQREQIAASIDTEAEIIANTSEQVDAEIYDESTPIVVEQEDDAQIDDEIVVEEDQVIITSTVTADRSPWQLVQPSFLLFVAWWAVLNLVAYTLAGEKMPWLGTHLTVPMILLSGWYFGRVFERISSVKLVEKGWLYLLLLPLLFVALFQIVAPFLGGQEPFQGTSSIQQQWTYQWMAVVIIAGGLIYTIYRWTQFTGWQHLRQLIAVVAFAMLALITFRSMWIANFINYDEASEFLVYAHGGPSNKSVIEYVEELSLRTTDGKDIRILHDDRFSWPGSWYLRDFTNTLYIGASTPSAQDVDNAAVIIVGDSNRTKVEPLIEDRFDRFDHIRMWWPMQDYFDLSATRINALFDVDSDKAANTRRGIFDIWWSRDYATYGTATANPSLEGNDLRFNIDKGRWPVSDTMHLYVRKDIIAQVWPYGVGDGNPGSVFTTVTENVCSTNWEMRNASVIFEREGLLQQPIGIGIGPDGNIYVAESLESASRISVFDADGRFIETIGEFGGAADESAVFNRPHSLTFGPNGDLHVVDTWNYRIRVFDPETLEMRAIWGRQDTSGEAAQREPQDGFWGPRDIAVDDQGRVYVADTGNKRIRVYDPAGQLLFDIGRAGTDEGQLNEPAGIAIANGQLFIADTWNRRLAIFNLDGTFVKNVEVRGWYEEQGNRPYLAIDEERDLLYVTDPDAGRILVYNTNGDCLGSFGQLTQGTAGSGQFVVVGGVAVDDTGNLYVSDMSAGRVMKFPPYEPPATDITMDEEMPVEADPEAMDESINDNEDVSVQLQIDPPAEETEETSEVEMTEEVEITEEIETSSE